MEAELATLAKEQASMDTIRAEEKAAYDKAKAELSAGIAGVQKALGVLKDSSRHLPPAAHRLAHRLLSTFRQPVPGPVNESVGSHLRAR